MTTPAYPARDRYREIDEARTYDARRFRSCRGRLIDRREQALIARALAAAGIAPPGRILDLPAGTGRLAPLLSGYATDTFGADLSRRMLGQATGYRQKAVLADAVALPFPDGTFDAVVSLRFTGHLPPAVRRAAFSEMARVSRRFVVVAVYDSTPWTRLRRRFGPTTAGRWFSQPLARTKEELSALGLRLRLALAVLPFFSETWVLLLERADAAAGGSAPGAAAGNAAR